jgi:putative FmdB family regulatory protein
MPIYEYQASSPTKACGKCRHPFEVLQVGTEKPLKKCPSCSGPVKRILSRCHAAVTEYSDEDRRVKHRIKEYESSGMWSHAAELADKHAEKRKDRALRARALDNYRKAGYDADSLAKHAETSND